VVCAYPTLITDREADDRGRVESYKLRRFATSARSDNSVSMSARMKSVSASIMHRETLDENCKKKQMDTAPADAFGAVMSVTGFPIRDRRSLLLTRDTGTAHGMHARRVQILQSFHPQSR
jgi:hypothetical protein